MTGRIFRALIVGLLALPSLARADVTVFVGSMPTPENRALRGLAVGAGLLVVAFEFEYANTGESPEAPSLRTGMGNVLVQTPFAIGGVQPYFTTGGGMYRERFAEREDTSIGFNVGGGAKIAIAGPLRLRLDYRVLTLNGQPVHARVHRVYAGANLKF